MIKTTMNPYINKFEDVDEMHYFQKKIFFNQIISREKNLIYSKTKQPN